MDSDTLADLKDLSFEGAGDKILEVISKRSGIIKSRSVLSKLAAQTARLLEGATQNQSLLLATGILSLLDDSDSSSLWSQAMNQLNIEESDFFLNNHIWKLLKFACSQSTEAKERVEEYLCSGESSLKALNRYNSSFKSDRVLNQIFIQFNDELKKVI